MVDFDIEKVVKPAVSSAKFFNSMIMVDSIRKAADSVVDAQAEFTRSIYAECEKLMEKYTTKTTK